MIAPLSLGYLLLLASLGRPKTCYRTGLSFETSYQVEVFTMKREQIITCDPEVLGGTPVFAGTRVPIQTLVDYLKGGECLEDFLDGYPSVSRAQAETFLEIALESTLKETNASIT